MKIAIVRQRYNPYGGAERFVERALGALAEEGAEISLITRDWAGAPQEGFRQISCNPSYSRWLGGRAARDRSFAQCVQQQIAAGVFDLVQSHERVPGCSIFRAGDGVHAAWLDHRSSILNPLARIAQRLSPYHRYVLSAEKAMFEHPALKAVICNSRMVADEIERYYGVDRSKLRLIYNGVDLTHFSPDVRDAFRRSQRASLGLDEQTPVLLYVGSGFERKGVPQLLRAMALMHEKSAHLVLVGADRRLKAMRQLADRLGLAARCHFIGPVSDVRPWYGAADAFVLPTLYDPGPNAALEALACGLPLLTSPGCGAREWIVAGRNGFICDPQDASGMALALDALLALGLEQSVRQLSRDSVAMLGLPQMAQSLTSLYREMLA